VLFASSKKVVTASTLNWVSLACRTSKLSIWFPLHSTIILRSLSVLFYAVSTVFPTGFCGYIVVLGTLVYVSLIAPAITVIVTGEA